METTPTGYEIRDLNVGILKQETVRSALMPRARFLEIVKEELEEMWNGDLIRAQVLETAQTMPRFPLGDWINETRGCGCLIGETLVAAGIITRDDADVVNVEDTIMKLDNGATLRRFGYDIDARFRKEIDAGHSTHVMSIEITA